MRARRTGRLWWRPLVVVAVVLLLRAGFMGLPFGDPDLGGIAYNAELLLEGHAPYRDSFEQKLPGTFLLWAAIFGVGGRGPTSIAVASLVWYACLALMVHYISRSLWGEGAAFAAAILYALFSSSAAVAGTIPNYETWMTLPLLLGFFLVLGWMRTGSLSALLGAGAAASAGLLMKQQAVFNVALLAVGVFWVGWRRRSRVFGGLTSVSLLAAGGVIPVFGVLVFLLAKGAWAELVECLHPRGLAVYSTAAPWRVVWELGAKQTRQVMLEGFALWVLGLSGAALLLRRSSSVQGEKRWLVLGWGAASFAGVVAGVRFFGHYYQQFLPFLAMGAASFWATVRPRLRSGVGVLLALTVLLSGWRTIVVSERVLWWRVKNIVTGSHVPPSLSQRVAAYLSSRTSSDESIYVWGHGEDIYHLAGRFAPTRYYKYWVFLNPPPIGARRLTANRAAGSYLSEFLTDLNARAPRFIVLDPRWSEASPDLVPEFARFLRRRYRPVRRFESVQVWGLKEP